MPEIPETCYAKTPDGVHIAYQVIGDGPFDLLFFPTPLSHVEARWEEPGHARFLRRLASFSRLILFDKRGFGLSDRVERLPSFDLQMDDVLAVMDAAGSQRAAAYGFFDGGVLAALVAATHPSRIQSLVLYAPLVKFVRSPDFPWGFSEAVVAEIRAEAQAGFSFERLLAMLTPSRAGDPDIAQVFSRWARLAAGPAGFDAFVQLMLHTDIRAVLPAVQAPTLVVARTDDTLFPPSFGRYVADQIPRARFSEMPGQDTGFWGRDFDLLADEIEIFLTGGRPVQEPERVLATILFTDIVSSTARAAEVGDRRWRELLDAHNSSALREVESHRGKLIKTTGDGVLVTFDGPGRAIACARALRDAAARAKMPIRAGLHTGEVERLDDDIGGIAVHIAARVLGEAGAGEILVSSSIPPLVAGSGTQFADRGEYELKGVPGAWRLFAVEG